MPGWIKDNFEPSEAVFDALRRKGIFKHFCRWEEANFYIYWRDLRTRKLAKGKKTSWDKTYFNWMTRAFEGKAGKDWEDRHKHQTRKGGLRNDLFGAAVESVNASISRGSQLGNPSPGGQRKTRQPNYRLPDPPAPGEAMDSGAAIEEMKKILGVK